MGKTDTTKTSTGHELSEGTYLDSHFEALRPEYEAMIRSVDLKPGWRVLDAGCGGGSFLPLLAELVGESGFISAIDLAPENIDQVNTLIENKPLVCPIETRVGNLAHLPYEDDHFDAVWCANITQYLTDEELDQTLAEFRRVVRPGGVVAIKEFDLTSYLFAPFDPTMHWRMNDVARLHIQNMQGSLRVFQLPTRLKQSKFMKVDFQSFLSERRQPLRPVEQTYFCSIFQLLSQAGEQFDLPEQDKNAWQAVGNFESADHVLKHPDFYWRENHIVVVGQVPES